MPDEAGADELLLLASVANDDSGPDDASVSSFVSSAKDGIKHQGG